MIQWLWPDEVIDRKDRRGGGGGGGGAVVSVMW